MNWVIKNSNPELQVKLSNSLDIHPYITQLLINRGILDDDDARHFLSAELSDLQDPFLLKGMDSAISRIKDAKKNNEKILVFGDYDVDGVASSAILTKCLKFFGINVINFIPSRMDDGYGLNHEIAEYSHKNKVKLLISVDCGISASDEVDTINSMGIDVIIVDHHEPVEGRIPKAFAVIDPKQKDCKYPFKHLASVGLTIKIVQALTDDITDEYLSLAAVGTIADIVPLIGENRILVKQGLSILNKTHNKGLLALMNLTNIIDKKLLPYHVGFIIGPRINAAGRMNTAHTALDLLLSDNDADANKLAKELDRNNTERQKIQNNIIQEAVAIVEQQVDFDKQKVIVISKEGWHKGVLGIVSSRITDKYYRPSIVISTKDGIGIASCRSINGFHLHSALSECSSCLEGFGGHKGAAGLTIKKDNISKFRDKINEVANKTIEINKLVPSIDIDCEIPINIIDMDFADIVDSMEPYGEGNPTPVFCSKNLKVKGVPRVFKKGTLKFWITDGNYVISAVGFGMESFLPLVRNGAKIDVAYNISIDDWNKKPEPQLKLKDIKISNMSGV